MQRLWFQKDPVLQYRCQVFAAGQSKTLLAQRLPSPAQLIDLTLHLRTYLGKGEAELRGPGPANRCTINDERISLILREDTELQLDAERDGYGTLDTAATRGQVSQFPITGHHPTLR